MPLIEPEHVRIDRAWVREETRARLFGGPAAPQRVGRFTLRERRGSGAMGTVYAAHDPTLDRLVALKLLHVEAGNADADSTLLGEARALARLSHPHAIPVFEVGQDGRALFVVSELVDGVDLRTWISSPRSHDVTLDVIARVGEALATAHALGIVHHDVKPDNILVENSGRARLGDFGLASIGARSGARARLAGTLHYAAPEKLLGERADAASDQYAFALTALEILLRRPMFVGSSIDELIASIRRGPPASHPGARALAPVLTVLHRAVSFSADDRYSSMFELLVALSAARVERPRHTRSFRIIMATTAALAVTGATVLAVRIWREADTRLPPSEVETPELAPSPRSSGPSESETSEVAITREMLGFTKAGRWTECAEFLSTRAHTKDLLVLWIGCAEYATDPEELERACAAWASRPAVTDRSPTPDICSVEVRAARAAQRRGDYVECAERILEAPPTDRGVVQLTRCTSQLGDGPYRRRACEYQQSMEPPEQRESCAKIVDLR